MTRLKNVTAIFPVRSRDVETREQAHSFHVVRWRYNIVSVGLKICCSCTEFMPWHTHTLLAKKLCEAQ